MTDDNKRPVPATPPTKNDMVQDFLQGGFSTDVMEYLVGAVAGEPNELSKIMNQASTRINVIMAYVVIQRLAQMNPLLKFMSGVEKSVLDPDRIKDMDEKDRMSYYRMLRKEVSEFFEFTRKFVLQNKNMFENRQPSDELADMLRTLDPTVVSSMLDILKQKGAATTVADVKGSPGEPAVSSKVAKLSKKVKEKQTGKKLGKKKKKGSSLFDEIMEG